MLQLTCFTLKGAISLRKGKYSKTPDFRCNIPSDRTKTIEKLIKTQFRHRIFPSLSFTSYIFILQEASKESNRINKKFIPYFRGIIDKIDNCFNFVQKDFFSKQLSRQTIHSISYLMFSVFVSIPGRYLFQQIEKDLLFPRKINNF